MTVPPRDERPFGQFADAPEGGWPSNSHGGVRPGGARFGYDYASIMAAGGLEAWRAKMRADVPPSESPRR